MPFYMVLQPFFRLFTPFYACKSLIKQHLNTFKAILNGIIALFHRFRLLNA
nr:MAG TPA: hypothetical protein [Caudoviricetes sp.]